MSKKKKTLKSEFYPLRKGFNDLLGYYTDRIPIQTAMRSGSSFERIIGDLPREVSFRINASINNQSENI